MVKNNQGPAIAVKAGDATATKDSGRVRVGAGAIQYDDVKQVATKDAGRTRIGAGAINF